MTKSQSVNEFIETLLSIKDKDEMKDFISGIFTAQELDDIPMRLQIVKMLLAGVPHHTIAKELGIGVATVTRGSKEIQKGRFKAVRK